MVGRNSESHRLHFGFLVVLALVITSFAPLSLGLSCAGIFYTSVSNSIGIGAGMLSYYTSILWIATIIFLPFFGKLLGRLDARLCLSAVVVIMALDFVWLSNVRALWQFYVGAFVMGIGVTMLLFLAPSTLINRWFAKRSGFFIGLVMAFTGVGGVVWSAVGGALINAIGWQMTYLVFAGITVCALPFTIFCVASYPKDKGLEPFGIESKPASVNVIEDVPLNTASGESQSQSQCAHAEDASASQPITAVEAGEAGITAKEAFRMPVFYLLVAMTFLINFGMYVYFIIPTYVNSLPIGIAIPLLGATASSSAMLGQTLSKLALGYAGDKYPGPAAAIGVGCGLVGVVMLMLVGSSAILVYAAAFIYGIFYGVTNVMMPILTRRSFGNREYPAIYSRVSMGASAGGVLCGFFWGTLIDVTGGFTVVFVGVAVCIVAVLVVIAAIEHLHKKHTQKGTREAGCE